MSPKISVIIPFHNGAKTLQRAVESVRNQSFEDWELILINDGSTDQSATIAKEYLSDARIRYLCQENQGVSAARNHGASEASAEWLIFLDADDVFMPNALELISNFTSDPNLSLIRGGFVRESHNSIKSTIPDGKSYISPLVGSFCVKKSVFQKIDGYDERMKFSENTELFHRLVSENLTVGYIPEPLFIYRETHNKGSKNLKNSIDSIEFFLTKHESTLSSHNKYTFSKVLGVNYLRYRNFKNSRKNFLISFRKKPWKFGVLIRYSIALFPKFARKLYKSDL